jgi:hypothetical protein
MALTSYICTTCGAGYAPSENPPDGCAICLDERQYVNAHGQTWTTLADLQSAHETDWRELEPGLFGCGSKPQIAIGERALFVPQPGGGVFWDTTPLVTEDAVARIKKAGGVRAMSASHPHFHTTMIDWSHALENVPIYIHEDNRDWVMRPDPVVKFWGGETLDLGQGITLVRCGGHFTGSAVLHWAAGAGGKGALFTGDTIMVTPDPRWMSFMRSFPNLIPLNERAVRRIVDAVAPYPFDRLYAGWWDRVADTDAKARVTRSAERYIAALK